MSVVLSEFPSEVTLPTDLFLDVLIRLPLKCFRSYKEKIKYLMRLRCVSRFFIRLINNPSFIAYFRLHSNIHFFDTFNFTDTTTTTKTKLYSSSSRTHCLSWPWRFHISFKGSNFIYLKNRHELIPFHCPNHKRLIGSINGLICFGGLYSLEIYNILSGTNYHLTLPQRAHPVDPNPIFVFGYNPIINDYNIIRFENGMIYSCMGNLWMHSKGLFCYRAGHSHTDRYGNSLEGRSVCINGIIYWPPGKRDVRFDPYYIWTNIVSFNLYNEKFRDIQLPEEDDLLPTQYADIQLLSFRGCLAFAFMERTGTSRKTRKPRKGRKGGEGEGEKTSSHGGEILVELFILKERRKKGGAPGDHENYSWIKESIVVPILSAPQKEAEIVSCCDEIFLGWFESKQLRLYNLHTKDFFNLSLSPPSHYYPKVSVGKKIKDPTYIENLRFDFSLL